IATSLGFWGAQYFPGDDGSIAGLLAAFSSNAFGAAIGALIGGPLCDKYGRKFIYTYDLLLYAVGGLVVTFAANLAMLFIGFVIIGLAVGASVPAGWTYIAEFAPPNRRGRHVGATQLAWSFGPFIGFGLAAALTPLGLLGSRIIFAHLVVIALVTWWIRQGLDESKAWQASKGGKQAKAPSMWTSFRGLFSRKANITALLFLAAIYTFWNQAASQNGIFLPTILGHMGWGTLASDLFSMLTWGIVILSTAVYMLLVDRVPYRWFFLVGGVLAVASWGVLVFGPSTAAATAFGYALLWGLSSGPSAQAFYSIWSPELFATPYRAGAQGIVFFVVRCASGAISLVFPVILAQHNGLLKDGLILIGFLLASTLIGTIWAPRTQGRPLEEIEIQRYGEIVSTQAIQSELDDEASLAAASSTTTKE
ncbi:MAG: MFS transporter, partial [Acidipropionibacterium sp.]|nr:MFS transporter [Acidipropionibacterium sp.]